MLSCKTSQVCAHSLQDAENWSVNKILYFHAAKHFFRRAHLHAVTFTKINKSGLDDRGIQVRFPVEERDLLFCSPSRPVLEPTYFLIQWVTGAVSSGIKRPEPDADRWPPSSVEVKLSWNSTSIFTYAFVLRYLIKQGAQTLTLTRDSYGFYYLNTSFVWRIVCRRYKATFARLIIVRNNDRLVNFLFWT